MRRPAIVLICLLVVGCCGSRGGGSGGWEVAQPAATPAVPVAEEPLAPPAGDLACFGERVETAVDEHVTLRAVADLDGDGKLDAVLQSSHLDQGQFTSVASVFLGEGDGRFRAAEVLPIGPFSYAVAVADLDGDGRLDLAANDHDRGAIALFLGAGDGTFRRGADLAVAGKPGEVSAADLDADGDADLIVSRYTKLELWRNDGRGGFTQGASLATGRAPEPPAVVDLDTPLGAAPGAGDHVDLVAVDNDDCTYRVFRGDGGARFHEAHRGDSCCPPADVHSGEFNSDGLPDVAWVCHDQGLQLATLDGAEVVFHLDLVDTVRADRLAVADLTGDGLDDLLVFDELKLSEIPIGEGMRTKVNLLAGDGDLGFTGVDQRMWIGQYGDPILADVTGDGRLDLIADNWQGREPGYLVVWPGVPCP